MVHKLKRAETYPWAAPSGASLSRRMLIGAAASVGLAATAARGQSMKTVKTGEANGSAATLGPKNAVLDTLSPDSVVPPITDHGSVPQFWQSFSLSHRRIQDGGWARQINVTDFPISKQIAAVT